MVTRKRKLRTDGSLWQHLRAPRVPYRRLTRNLQTDVLIVGAGITGAMIGETLAEAGLAVVVVDRRVPATGSTIASTALVQYEIDTPLLGAAGEDRQAGRRAGVAPLAPRGHGATRVLSRAGHRGADA